VYEFNNNNNTNTEVQLDITNCVVAYHCNEKTNEANVDCEVAFFYARVAKINLLANKMTLILIQTIVRQL